MSTNPTYIVTPHPGAQPAVHIEASVTSLPHNEKFHPVILRAAATETLPLMQNFLSGLSLNTSWMARESLGTAWIKGGVLPDGVSDVVLYHASNSSKPAPTDWYCIVAYDEDLLLELNVLSETLAHQLFDALLAGTLQLHWAEPNPVHP